VVVANKMKNTMNQQKPKLMFKGNAGLSGIGRCAFGGDNHVSEQVGIDPAALAFLHGEGDHVGRPIPLQVVAVNSLNTVVVKDQNGQFGLRKSRGV